MCPEDQSLDQARRQYGRGPLARANLHTDPFVQFQRWFDEARERVPLDPNAMTLATVGKEGAPTVRTVLLKFYDERGFVFFTNLGSRKASQIEHEARVALLFWWPELERQVEIAGVAQRVSNLEAARYFMTRPRGSQIGAWVSDQSHALSSRQALESKLDEMKRKFTHREVPLPSFWGGFRVAPKSFEFWQGQRDRLHDRFQYELDDALPDGEWRIQRLAP